MEKKPEFMFGSYHSVVMDVVVGELSLMIFSALCILVGLFMVSVSLYFNVILKTGNRGLAFLGLFSIALGLWKITDLKSAALLLPEHSMALGYVSVGSLLLTGESCETGFCDFPLIMKVCCEKAVLQESPAFSGRGLSLSKNVWRGSALKAPSDEGAVSEAD